MIIRFTHLSEEACGKGEVCRSVVPLRGHAAQQTDPLTCHHCHTTPAANRTAIRYLEISLAVWSADLPLLLDQTSCKQNSYRYREVGNQLRSLIRWPTTTAGPNQLHTEHLSGSFRGAISLAVWYADLPPMPHRTSCKQNIYQVPLGRQSAKQYDSLTCH